jgi:hypothetical protein
LGRRWLDLLIVGVPFVSLPYVLSGLIPDAIGSGGRTIGLLAGLPGLVFTGAASLITYTELSDAPRVTAGEAIRRGAGKFGSLWGASFIANLGIIFGLLLLVVPGVIAIIGWTAAQSAVVVEGKTAGAALSRSWELTRGSRWRLAALLGIAALAVLGLLVAMVLVLIPVALAFGEDAVTPITAFVVTPIWALMFITLTTVGAAAVYTGLRIAKEGDAGDVSAVFA